LLLWHKDGFVRRVEGVFDLRQQCVHAPPKARIDRWQVVNHKTYQAQGCKRKKEKYQ
jgi:hypothetical protein